MTIDVQVNQDTAKVTVDGNITYDSLSQITPKLNSLSETPQITKVVLDLTTVNTITSAGLGKLIALHKTLQARNGELIIEAISPPLFEQFDEINLTSVFKVNKPE